MNIVFMVDYYYPKFSAVSKCAYNLAVELAKTHNVTVLSLDGDREEAITEMIGNHNLKRGYVKELVRRKYAQISMLSSNKSISMIYKFYYLYLRTKSYLKAIVSKYNINEKNIEVYEHLLKDIDVDVIIPVCIPFEAVIAGFRYKRNNPKSVLIPILFDKFTYNKALHRNKINMIIKERNHTALEFEMIKYANAIYTMHQLKQTYEKMFHKEIEKFIFIEHPLIKEFDLPNKTKGKKYIKLIYAGALYKKFRSPQYLLEIFSIMNGNYELDFYSSGNCEKIIRKYIMKSKNCVYQHGYVNTNELNKAYADADFLIGIGNKNMNNVTSKIFEYISIGKPIIHFYYDDSDPVLELLKRYPLAICIKQNIDYIKSNAEKIEVFCQENYNRRIEFSEIEKYFWDASPKLISKMIESKFDYIDK